MSDLVANCFKLERQLTRDEKQTAFWRVQSLGWPPGSHVPAYIWQHVYMDILLARGATTA